MTTGLDRTFRLGTWTVKPRLGELAGPPGNVHLEPKVMGVLVLLAENAGEVVSRDQFAASVWDGRPVTDEVLSRCISILRTQFADNPRKPRFIQTVPKIGYRLVQPVAWGGQSAPADTTWLNRPPTADTAGVVWLKSRKFVALSVLGVAALGILTTALLIGPGNDSPGLKPNHSPPTVAVLPFSNLGGEDNEPLRDGLTEDLINALANLSELRVVASTSVFAFKDSAADVRQVASELGADFVMQGSVRKDSDRLRINTALIGAVDGVVRWSNRFDTDFGDYFSVQDEITTSIVRQMLPRLTGQALARVNVAPPTTVMPAYELVLQGRSYLRRREEEPILRSIDLFQRAIELDPEFGDAYRDLARAFALLPTYSYEDPEDMFGQADAYLAQSVVAEPAMEKRIYDVRAFLHYARWEWALAEQNFRLALEQMPNDPNLHQWYSQLLAAVGMPELALEAVLNAKQLDMLSPVVNQRLAVVYQWNDNDERAFRYFELASELGMGTRTNPESFAIQLLRRQDFDRAREVLLDLQRAFARASEWIDPFIAALKDPSRRPTALMALREADEARQISLKYLQGAYVFLGDGDSAIDVAFDLLHDPVNFEVEFLFARESAVVRAHPRFGELVRAIGLDEYWDEYGWPKFCSRQGDGIECQ